ncbi:hypothetical protein RRG08_012585 [Elysia crispata]|uniref:Uncharacterized protein n=1 Tax=Elysia crispata TaxID=231223 RepID=A0AAE1AJJ8_9GAST|nr:hypothetical protein RRG08_012585 [Elysia crispata]
MATGCRMLGKLRKEPNVQTSRPQVYRIIDVDEIQDIIITSASDLALELAEARPHVVLPPWNLKYFVNKTRVVCNLSAPASSLNDVERSINQ